jgi:hypothetical protein
VKVHCDEGIATHIGPKPCAGVREDSGEASAGERIGQPLSREIGLIPGADGVHMSEGEMDGRAIASARPTRRGPRPSHGNVSVKGKIHSLMSKTPAAVSASKV